MGAFPLPPKKVEVQTSKHVAGTREEFFQTPPKIDK
jgi:hypothetical protein